jgi:hypothetical protein
MLSGADPGSAAFESPGAFTGSITSLFTSAKSTIKLVEQTTQVLPMMKSISIANDEIKPTED